MVLKMGGPGSNDDIDELLTATTAKQAMSSAIFPLRLVYYQKADDPETCGAAITDMISQMKRIPVRTEQQTVPAFSYAKPEFPVQHKACNDFHDPMESKANWRKAFRLRTEHNARKHAIAIVLGARWNCPIFLLQEVLAKRGQILFPNRRIFPHRSIRYRTWSFV